MVPDFRTQSLEQAVSCNPEIAEVRSIEVAAPGFANLSAKFGNWWESARSTGLELLYCYSTLLFVRSPLLGAVLLVCSFLNMNLGLSGLIALVITFIFSRALGIKSDHPVHMLLGFNALIVGFSIGFLFRISFLSLLLTVGASIFTVLVCYTFYSLLSKNLRLPVLNLPFLTVSTMIYLASVRYSSLFVNSFYIHDRLNINAIPPQIQGLLRSMGILIFMPYDICGILMLAGLLAFSRIAFFMAILSYYLGTTCSALLSGNFQNAYMNVYSFNFILIGVALGGVFLIPSRRSYVFALLGVFVSVFVLDAASVMWTNFGVPVFTLPFNIVVLTFVYVMMQIGYPEVTLSIKASPEASLSTYLNFTRRFDRVLPKPFLPFSGRWTIYQGFESEWTHKGVWKYAYDFVMEDADGKTHRNQGDALEDYYCYGKPVLTPVSGTVVDAGDCLRDNSPGEIDKSDNWGNYIIIYSQYGYYVEISHLQKGSLKVKSGDSVKVGEVVAACGNSGHSPQPHIHFQVQYLPQLGSETVRFYFSNCLDGDRRLVGNHVLERGMKVDPFSHSRKLSKKLTFLIDDSLFFKIYKNGTETGELRLRVKMAPDGSRYFSAQGTEDRLYFGFEDNCFVFYSFDGKAKSPLRFLFAALPRVPLCSETGVSWSELIPDNILFSKDRLHGFFKSFHHDLGKITGTYRLASEDEIRGEISNGKNSASTRLVLDQTKGFSELEVKVLGNSFSLKKAEN